MATENALTGFGENLLTNVLTGNVTTSVTGSTAVNSLAAPTRYLALFSGPITNLDPLTETGLTVDGTAAEMAEIPADTYTWYARQPVTFYPAGTVDANGVASASASAGFTCNVGNIDFGEVLTAPAEGYVGLKGWVLYDALTGGNQLAYGMFTKAKNAAIGTNIIILANDITIQGN